MAPTAPMRLALLALAAFGGSSRRAVLVRLMALTVTLGARPALFRAATGPPNFNQLRFGRSCGSIGDNSGFAGSDDLRGCFDERFGGCFDSLVRRGRHGLGQGQGFFRRSRRLRRCFY